MNSSKLAIHWFRQDLRQRLNGALIGIYGGFSRYFGGSSDALTGHGRALDPRACPIPEPQGGVYQSDSMALPSINALNLLPRIRWDQALAPHWDIGERRP